MARLGLQTVTAFVLAATALGFVAPAPSRAGLSVRGRALQMKQHTGDFWIAPSILSADFAKLGQEVRLPCLAWPRRAAPRAGGAARERDPRASRA